MRRPPAPFLAVSQWGEALPLGPVVVVAARVDDRSARALEARPLTHWPLWNAERLLEEGRRIGSVVAYDMVVLAPRKWNQLLTKVGSRDRVLDWAYRTAIKSMLSAHDDCAGLMIDRRTPGFAVLETELPSLTGGRPLVYVAAESPDPVLEATGLLARQGVIEAQGRLERRHKWDVPTGDGDPVPFLEALMLRVGRIAVLTVAKKDDPRVAPLLARD